MQNKQKAATATTAVIVVLCLIIIIGGVWYSTKNKPESDNNQNLSEGCKDFYWYDNEHATCQEPKQFCGTYMYLGLQTFETKEECEVAISNK
jgi:hypothetical protein